MTQPIYVRVDLAAHAAYVKYAPGPSVSTVDLNDTGSVAYDVDLAFPRDLAGNFVAA